MLPYIQKCKCCGKRIGIIQFIKDRIALHKLGYEICEQVLKENPDISNWDLMKKTRKRALMIIKNRHQSKEI